mgnify:CR=1 FL=1
MPSSGVLDSSLFLCLTLDAGHRGKLAEARVRMASAVERSWLPASWMTSVERIALDPETGRIEATEDVQFLGLTLESKPIQNIPAERIESALCTAALVRPDAGLDLGSKTISSWLARLNSLRDWMPELCLPDLLEELADHLPALSLGCRSLCDLKRVDVYSYFQGVLTHSQHQILDRYAPATMKLPRGRTVTLRYAPGSPPVLAARIQDLFGVRETPRVAQGRVPVMVHLLAPNMRPQQVTQDLAGFWQTTYSEVRKELRGRYPKHAWPEDPLD